MLWFALAAAAEPVVSEAPRIVVVIDRSRSVGADGLRLQRAMLDAMVEARPDATWGVMASDAAAVWLVEPYVDRPVLPDDIPLRHGSELPSAIALARVFEPAPTEVVALTDGLISQRLPPKAPPTEGAPTNLVVWTDGPHDTFHLTGYARGGAVIVADDPVAFARRLVAPELEEVPLSSMKPPEVSAQIDDGPERVAAAVRSVVEGCIKKPKHRERLAPILVETTRDEIVYLDLSKLDEDYRWCLSGALFELELPGALRGMDHLTVEVDLREE